MKAQRTTNTKEVMEGRFKKKKKRDSSQFKCLVQKCTKVSSCHPIISCSLDDHSSIYTSSTARTATLHPPTPLWRLGASTFTPHTHAPHLSSTSTRTMCFHMDNNTHVRITSTRTHTHTQTESRRGGENMQQSCETTWDSTCL